MQTHTDNRRTIYDWAEVNFKSAKALIVHEPINIGDHYHNNKVEEFLLISGEFLELQLGNETEFNVKAPHKVVIPKGLYHRFVCTKGSILLGVATELFDENDEIKQLL